MIKKIKYYTKLVISALCDCYYHQKWKRVKGNCLNSEEREENIIVSLTSFPGRINIVHKTVQTILMQKKVKPDEVELWLAVDQFPNKEKDLPNSLLSLTYFGLNILWCKDIRSYKKLIPSLKHHPNDVIITADDDVYYESNWLEKLYTEHLMDKSSILCNKATMFYIDKDDNFQCISGGKKYYPFASSLNKLVGIGGVLYPRNAFDCEIMKENVFMEICRTNDDIWFWLMAVKNQRKVKVVRNNSPKPIDVLGSQKTEKLTDINDNGEMHFWKQFRNVCNYYPLVEKILREEYAVLTRNEIV